MKGRVEHWCSPWSCSRTLRRTRLLFGSSVHQRPLINPCCTRLSDVLLQKACACFQLPEFRLGLPRQVSSSSGLIARWQSPDPPSERNKVGSLPSGRVLLSQALNGTMNPSDSHKRFRISLYAAVAGSNPAPPWGSRPARCLFRHMPPLLPRKILRVGVRSAPSDSGLPLLTTGSASPSKLTRLPLGSRALRPAALPMGNFNP